MKKLIISIFQKNSGLISSKRLVGVLCALALIVVLFISCFTRYQPNETVVNSVTILCVGCLGLTTIDGFNKEK